MTKKLFVIAAVLAVTMACRYGRNGVTGNSASFGFGTSLHSHYVYAGNEEPIPVCHVVFVPQWDLPRVDHGFTHGDGGGEETFRFRFAYHEQGVPQFEVKPLVVHRRFLRPDVFEGGGRQFELRDGNVFVAAVHRDGSVQVTQLPRRAGIVQADEILALMKAELPNDRVQALSNS